MMSGKLLNCNCVASNCYNSSFTHPEYAYFFIPRKHERRVEWLRRIDRADWIDNPAFSKYRRVCEVHFAPKDIIYRNNKKTLRKTAVPTRHLSAQYPNKAGVKSEPVESCSDAVNLTSKITQTTFEGDIEIKSSIATQTNIDFKSYTEFHDLCDTYLTNELTQLVKANTYISDKSKLGRVEYRHFCWDFYQTSPEAYQFLQCVFDFPTATSLVKQYIPTGTGIHGKLLLTLKTRVDKMNKKERNCCLLIGFTELKASLCYNIMEDKIIGFEDINNVQYPTPAKKALVIMIRGLLSCWKQPVGYLLIPESGNSKIIDWIDNAIKSIFEIGLNVRAVISALDDDLMNESQKIKEVSVAEPYFIVNDKKIYHIYDSTDLIKAVRDNLMVNDFHFHGNVAKYEHVVEFYNEDQKMTKQLACKLTKSHISPTDAEMGELEYAIQLLSASVAAGIWNFANFKLIDEKGKDTAEFISKINHTFDMLNTTNQRYEDNDYKTTFCGNETQTLFLNEMIALFQNLKLFNYYGEDVTSAAKFINGFLITIKSILLLFDDLKSEGHTFLPTRNLHSECLKNFLSQMGTENPNKLTSQRFITEYRKLFFNYHKKFTLGGRSIEGEVNKCLKKYLEQKEIEKNMSGPMTPQNPTPCKHDGSIKIQKGDYMEIDTAEKHSLFYLCGYLLMKSRENHNKCQKLLNYMRIVKSENPKSDFTHVRYRQFEQQGKLLAVPCDDFVNFVEQMDRKFIQAFETKQINCKIVESVYDAIQKIDYKLPCPCFPKTYFIKLFLRIKIFYTVRFNNREFRKQRGCLKITVPTL